MSSLALGHTLAASHSVQQRFVRARLRATLAVVCGAAIELLPRVAQAAMRFELDGNETLPNSSAVKMALVLTLLSLAPALLLTTTSFVRIAVVMTFLRNALGTQNMPPTQVLMGLSLFLTLAVMAPVGKELWSESLSPYFEGTIDSQVALERGSKPVRTFLLSQTRRKDVALFYDITHTARPKTADDVAMQLLIPAFVISELRTAFEMGFIVYLPFLLIDLIVASILMALGMAMVPPAMLSLPLKVMLFVLADGWRLIASSLVRSFA